MTFLYLLCGKQCLPMVTFFLVGPTPPVGAWHRESVGKDLRKISRLTQMSPGSHNAGRIHLQADGK